MNQYEPPEHHGCPHDCDSCTEVTDAIVKAAREKRKQTSAATTATDQISAASTPKPEYTTAGVDADCSNKLTAERSGPKPAPGDTEVSAAGSGIVVIRDRVGGVGGGVCP